MSAYVGKLFTAVSSALEFNTATLSGAIDIIVVEDDLGRRNCTPFHVRFGKLQLLKSRGIPVSVYVNGQRTDLTMLLGAAGEAYFYNPQCPSTSDSEPPHHLDLDDHAAHPMLDHPCLTDHRPLQTTASEGAEVATDDAAAIITTDDDSAPTVQFQIAHVPDTDPSPAPTPPLMHNIPSTPPPSSTVTSSLPVTVDNTTITSDPASGQQRHTSNSHNSYHNSHPYNHHHHHQAPTVSETVDTDYPFSYISDSEVELTRTQRAGDAEVVDEPRSPPLFPPTRDWAAGPHHPGPLTVHDFVSSTRPATSARDPTLAAPSASSIHPNPHRPVPFSAPPATNGGDDANGSGDEQNNSLLFGLPASPPLRSSHLAATADDEQTTNNRQLPYERSASPHSSSSQQVRRSPNTVVFADDIAPDVDADDQPDHLRANHDVTVTDTLSDVVGEEDAKLDCRSLDGFDPPDSEDILIGLQHRVTSVLSSRAQAQDAVERASNASTASAPVRTPPSPPSPATIDGLTTAPGTATATSANGSVAAETIVSNIPEPNDEVAVLSLCGSLLSVDMTEAQILELFERHRVNYEEFAANPGLLFDPALRVRFDNRIVELRVAAPLVFAAIAYGQPMDIDELARLTVPIELEKEIQEPEPPKSPPTPRRFRWLPWSSPAVEGEPLLGEEDIDELDKRDDEANKERAATSENDDGEKDEKEDTSERQVRIEEPGHVENHNEEAHESPDDEESSITPENDNKAEMDGLPLDEDKPVELEQESMDMAPSVSQPTIAFSELDPESLTLKPTLEELNSLDLQPGANTVRFVVESSAVELTCRIFLWSCHHKVVISDVDGTITRSDVLGHLLPAVGRDWSQVGVAGLYSQIEKNGYKLMYLTARPIGQASQTRAFLHSVTQGNAKLPNGPVLMSPNRLVESFTREVIRRKPHEFKIAALRELRSLFSPADNPFYAGFGNRDTDVISYRAVGLMPQRIFVVNPKGELVVMKSRFESAASYSTLQDLVENVFPDISGKRWLAKTKAMTESATYNDWNYWKGTLPEVDFDELLKM